MKSLTRNARKSTAEVPPPECKLTEVTISYAMRHIHRVYTLCRSLPPLLSSFVSSSFVSRLTLCFVFNGEIYPLLFRSGTKIETFSTEISFPIPGIQFTGK